MNKRRSVRGRIIISGDVPRFSGATAHITLEDISYMDSESAPVAELSIRDVSHNEGKTIITFLLEIDDPSVINERNDYAIGVWIDVDGTGQPGERDLFSKENHLVLTRGFGDSVEVRVT